MTLDDARAYALSLPETAEEPHFERTSFRVKGKIFATALPGGDSANIFVGEDDIRAAVAENPAAFEEVHWGKRLVGVRVKLALADADTVREMIHEAWRIRAPKGSRR